MANKIKRTVMLSQPFPLLSKMFLESNRFSKSSTIALGGLFIFKSEFTTSNSPQLLPSYRYQMPSQPIRMNLSSALFLSMTLMSGLQVTICSEYGKSRLVLYMKSPKARDKFKLPFTLPFWMCPPAFSILLSSS